MRHSTSPNRTAIRSRNWIAAAALSTVLVVAPATAARAANLPNLPQSAGGYELTFAPAYDYDGDGCYPVAAIAPDGTLNGGLNTTGAVNGNCRDQSDLDRTQTYARSKCNNGWCAIVYASYFEKDQILPGCCGHRHDWEHVVSWVNQASDRVDYVSRTVHGEVQTYPRSSVRFDGTHPKVVYHKEGAFGSHNFRLANSNDDPPENHYGTWRFPPVVDWNGWPSAALRDRLMTADFGSASIKITDQDDRFRNLLNRSKPAGIPFDPWA